MVPDTHKRRLEREGGQEKASKNMNFIESFLSPSAKKKESPAPEQPPRSCFATAAYSPETAALEKREQILSAKKAAFARHLNFENARRARNEDFEAENSKNMDNLNKKWNEMNQNLKAKETRHTTEETRKDKEEKAANDIQLQIDIEEANLVYDKKMSTAAKEKKSVAFEPAELIQPHPPSFGKFPL